MKSNEGMSIHLVAIFGIRKLLNLHRQLPQFGVLTDIGIYIISQQKLSAKKIMMQITNLLRKLQLLLA